MKLNERYEERPDRAGSYPVRLSHRRGSQRDRPLIGLLYREPSALWRQADPDTLQFQRVATKGGHHRRGCSFWKMGEPTRRPMKTVRLKKDGQAGTRRVSAAALGVVDPSVCGHHSKRKLFACCRAIRNPLHLPGKKFCGCILRPTPTVEASQARGSQATTGLDPRLSNCGLSPMRAGGGVRADDSAYLLCLKRNDSNPLRPARADTKNSPTPEPAVGLRLMGPLSRRRTSIVAVSAQPARATVPVAGYSPDADLRLVWFIDLGVASRIRSHSQGCRVARHLDASVPEWTGHSSSDVRQRRERSAHL